MTEVDELPGASDCPNEWHLLKCVSAPTCPDCGMPVADFNRALREKDTARAAKKRHRFVYVDGIGTCKDCSLKRWHPVFMGQTTWHQWQYETPLGREILDVVPTCPPDFVPK